jgi:demethylmenaquinone methyltransferase/2-methoxy-6-polyprenyl-1,4-benzoquinol methylase
MVTSERKLSRNYDRAAWFYETSSHIYSTGQIKVAKVSQLRFLQPGQRVLYLGVGAGEDALEAARMGLQVTCIDISQGMLQRLQRKLNRAGLTAELICCNAFDHCRYNHYDAVATNFFLNCFKRPMMQEMMKHALSLVKPGGRFLVADVSPPQGSLPARVFNLAYSKWAMAMFWAMRLVPWHENYDYAAELRLQGMTVDDVSDFRLAKLGPIMFQSVAATKRLETPTPQPARRPHVLGAAPHSAAATNPLTAASATPPAGDPPHA